MKPRISSHYYGYNDAYYGRFTRNSGIRSEAFQGRQWSKTVLSRVYFIVFVLGVVCMLM